MRTYVIVATALLVPLLVPTSAADHLPCAYEAQGQQQRSEAIGLGPVSVGNYTRERGQGARMASADGSCAPRDCKDVLSNPRTPEVGTPEISTPDVRVLGETVVPSQHVDRIVILPSFPIPIVVLDPSCLPVQDVGVYVRVNGVVNVAVGTDRVPIVTAPFLP